MPRARRITASMALCVLTALAAIQPAAAVPDTDPPENPFLTYDHPQDWTLRATVDVTAWQDLNNRTGPIRQDIWSFETAAVIFPLVEQTAAANLDIETAAGTLRFADRDITSEFTVISGYHSGQKYARFDAINVGGGEMDLVVNFLARAWRTRLDEDAARRVGWPTGEWPEDAASTFEPQPFVELPFGRGGSIADIERLVHRWTEGNDPKSIPPFTLAKWLAGKVVEHVQPSGDGLERGELGFEFEGFKLQGAPLTATTGRGSPFDATALLAAVYRRAGIPARIVIAYREVSDDDDRQDRDDRGAERLRSYVEFYLYDEPQKRGGWIPVDIGEMRRTSSRAGDLDRPWRYFGTHDELDLFVPLAFNYHPPTTVRAYGAPALWGWLVTPTPPFTAFQRLDFSVSRTPKRGGQPVLPAER